MSLADIKNGIAEACAESGRNPADITLLAVTKTRTPEMIMPLLNAGHRTFAENRVQEAEEKYPALRTQYPDLQLHFIGHLQSNKAREAVALFDCIHTIDRASIADAVANEMIKQNRRLPCFIQVNTGEEPQKGGVAPKDLDALMDACRAAQLDIRGLMCIPPEEDVASLHFLLLNKLAAAHQLPFLSMGMSADFKAAIRCGSTHLRVGSALFG